MEMTTERKVYIGLALAGVVALIIDRGFLSPATASADSMPTPAPAASMPVAVENHAAKQEAMPAVEILNERLRQVNIDSDVMPDNDVFSLSSWLDGTSSQAENGQGIDTADASGFPRRPTDLPKVSSVMPMADKVGAVLDGRYVVIGQTTKNGYQLTSVQNRSVVVEKGGKAYVLSLQAVPGSDNSYR